MPRLLKTQVARLVSWRIQRIPLIGRTGRGRPLLFEVASSTDAQGRARAETHISYRRRRLRCLWRPRTARCLLPCRRRSSVTHGFKQEDARGSGGVNEDVGNRKALFDVLPGGMAEEMIEWDGGSRNQSPRGRALWKAARFRAQPVRARKIFRHRPL